MNRCSLAKYIVVIIGVVLIGFFFSCVPKQEDITIYVMLDDVKPIDLMISQYNNIQKKYRMKYRKITPNQLKDVLENNIERENLFLTLTRHDIPQRAQEKFYYKIFPEFNNDIRVFSLTRLAKNVIRITRNFGYPLYVYDLSGDSGVSVATLGVPLNGYKKDIQLDELVDVLRFFNQAEINVQSLFYDYMPVYTDAGYSILSSDEAKRVEKKNFPLEKLDLDLLPKSEVFIIAR